MLPRSVSWLLAAKCLTVAMTCWLWTPRISATANWLVRNGSSLNVSKARPHNGTRRMLTVGVSAMLRPLPQNSRPIALPHSAVSVVSHVDA